VDFPVPRGPKRKKLESAALKKRGINSILRLKVEFTIPFYQLKEPEASDKCGNAPKFTTCRIALFRSTQVKTAGFYCGKIVSESIEKGHNIP
jgi:hypothetical protein